MNLSIDGWVGGAEFSPCGVYRYSLSREWADGDGTILFVMLNPSTANADANDPTIRRCMGFARSWGAKRIEIRNLFAFRATDPKDMVAALGHGTDIVGPENDSQIEAAHGRSSRTFAAWGAHPLATERGKVAMRILSRRPVFCFGTSKSGAPRHPLYVPSNFLPLEYRP
jgi:hypothetical protein